MAITAGQRDGQSSSDGASGLHGGKPHGRLGELVSDYLHRSPSSRPETSQDKLSSTVPSKTLPATGLKRNTEEWKEAHGDEQDGRGHGHGQEGEQQLPDTATGAEGDGRGEGPRGRGAGKHEDTIPLNRVQDQSEAKDGPSRESRNGDGDGDGGWLNGYASRAFGLDGQDQANGHQNGHNEGGRTIHDSPVSSHTRLSDEHQLSSPPNGQSSSSPEPKSSAFTSALPHRSPPSSSSRQLSGGPHERPGDVPERDEAKERDKEGKLGSYKEGGYERSDTHDSDRNRKMTDELGRYPAMLAGVKEEEQPGNRNDIVLDSRVTHMHYHREVKHENAKIIQGPILTVTADGEQEYLPGHTPGPSRSESRASKMSAPEKRDDDDEAAVGREQASGHAGQGRPQRHDDGQQRPHDPEHHKGYGPRDETKAARSERQQDAYERGMREASFSRKGSAGQIRESGSTKDGRWRGALDPEDDVSDSETGGGFATPASRSRKNLRPTRKESRWSSFRDDPQSKHASTPSHPHPAAAVSHPMSHSTSHRNSTYSGVEGDTSDLDDPSRSHSTRARVAPGQKTPRRQSSGSTREGDGDGDAPNREAPEVVQEHAQRAWSNLRSRVMPSRQATGDTSGGGGVHGGGAKQSAMAPSAVAAVPVTTELMAGQLPVMIMKTWLDRDEDGNRAVPVVLGSLRFRVGDSVGLKADGGQTGKEMFKLECEYGDGAVKWVIYRELRDFLSLHAHYKAANFGTSVPGVRSSRHVDIPEFPKMSIPYLKTISGGRQRDKEKPMSKAEYAQASRDALQKYLVELIRAVIFRPESNRLCKFFELSALTLSLAPRGGFQGKAGYLKIPGSNASRRANQPGLSPISWMNNRSPKWFIIRDSYFVATDGPESSELYEVFLIDEDFHIERPKRVYRTGMHFLTGKGTLKRRKDGAPNMLQNGDMGDADAENPIVREMLINNGEGTGEKGTELDIDNSHDGKDASHHTFFIVNSQRKLKLVAKNARQMHQFIVSMERIAASCVWAGRNRFDSYAPLRVDCSAQWLVDGRDYFWNLSRAINMAKERIYIHDWWISPEIYLRRPGNERYRLDNLLKRKAEDGVKICIIIYNEVSDNFTPVDSTYTKSRLTGLHPNIMVQRSPSHFQTGTFYWSHHEKLCVIDETIAFMGGLDLCFGRWDTSQHVLTDEDFTEPNGPNGPVWHGKDYANERVAEYSALNKPFEESIDRHKVPRMPWHDVGVQLVGQPARDLCRHFVQRWNLLLRTKNHKRKMPFLLPPPDFVQRELEDMKLSGTCEVQICRSVGPWSMNTLEKVEHSIQNAYVKSISLSEHFVYIENQFFITSTVVDGIPVENGIGDAIVNRIIRAHKEKTPWRACVVIPLLPGYTFPIDASEASSVRLILECQNRTICRGTNSIYSRLRAEGIDPNDYISFFSLRGWAKFKSGALTTEQVYIHGKTCIIDDRLALIGSANINERSQMGDRDSELLSVIRDTDMIDGTMAGKPFKVGRFAHTLRMRLMREHVGVDVDAIEEDELITREPIADADEIEVWDPDHEQHGGDDDDETRGGITSVSRRTAKDRLVRTFQSGAGSIAKGVIDNVKSDMVQAGAKMGNAFASATSGKNSMIGFEDGKNDASERRDMQGDKTTAGFAGSVVPTMEEKTIFERRPSQVHGNGKPLFDLIEGDESAGKDAQEEAQGLTEAKVQDEEDVGFGDQVPADKDQRGRGIPYIREPPGARKSEGKSEGQNKAGQVGDGKEELYGMPANAHKGDNEVPNANTERDESTEQERLAVKARKTLRKHLNAKTKASPWSMPTPTPMIDPNRFHDPLDEKFWKDMWTAVAVHNTEIYRKVFRCIPDDLVTSWAQYKAFASHAEKFNLTPIDVTGPGTTEPVKVHHDGGGTHGAGGGGSGGGVVGQEGQSGQTAESQGADIVNGKPRETLDVPGASRAHSAMSNISRTVSETVSGRSSEDDKAQKDAIQEERKQSQPNEAFHDWEREEMEELLGELRGHLVVYPTRFMEAEDAANNFLFNSDKIMPLPIYN